MAKTTGKSDECTAIQKISETTVQNQLYNI